LKCDVPIGSAQIEPTVDFQSYSHNLWTHAVRRVGRGAWDDLHRSYRQLTFSHIKISDGRDFVSSAHFKFERSYASHDISSRCMPEEDGSASDSDEVRPAGAEAAAERPAEEEQGDDNDEGDDSDEGFLHCICLDLYSISLGDADEHYTHCNHLATSEGFAAEELHICLCRCDPSSEEYKQRYPFRWSEPSLTATI
jgi:hypothetical protein